MANVQSITELLNKIRDSRILDHINKDSPLKEQLIKDLYESLRVFVGFSVINNQNNQNNYNIETSKKYIKSLCQAMTNGLFTRFELDYEGSGDSGGFDTVELLFYNNYQSPDKWGCFTITSDDYKLCNNQVLDKGWDLLENLLDFVESTCEIFLPMGFEINEGGLGTLIIDIKDKTISIEHKQRVIDYEENKYSYDLLSGT